MAIGGALVLVAGVVSCLVTFLNKTSNLMTPEIYLSGVAAIVGAILCAVGEISRLRTTIESKASAQPEATDTTKEE